MGGISTAKDLLALAAAESGSEAFTEMLNITEESINASDSPEEFLEKLATYDNLHRTNYSAMLGGILGLAMGGPGSVSTNITKKKLMELEEEAKAADYVRAKFAMRQGDQTRPGEMWEIPTQYTFNISEGVAVPTTERTMREENERLDKRDAARQRARERIDEALGRERQRDDFEYEGTSLTDLGVRTSDYLDADQVQLGGVSGLESRFQAPQEVVEESVPTVQTPWFNEPVARTIPGQEEIELLGRQRDPRALRDPQNVPPVGTAMVDEALDLEGYTAPELAEFARETIRSRREQVPGIQERAFAEIDEMEDSGDIEGLQQIVRTQIDSRDLRGRVEERIRVTPLELDVAPVVEAQPTREAKPGETWEITPTGQERAKRFPIESVRDKAGEKTFRVISMEKNGDVHVRFEGPATQAYKSEVAGEADPNRGWMEAYWNVNDPAGTLTIKEQAGLRKTKVPLEWRRNVTETAVDQTMGYVPKVSQRMKGKVGAKIPFVGAPTLALHQENEANKAVSLAKSMAANKQLDRETERIVREQAREDAKKTQERKTAELEAALKGVDGGPVTWKAAPKVKLDGGAQINSIISKNALNRLNSGNATHERAYQILPDGRTRVLEIVPTGKGQRYGVFALSEDSAQYVNPKLNKKSPSGKPITPLSKGIKIGTAGAVVRDLTIEKIKLQDKGKSKTLAGGLNTVRTGKVAADSPAPATAEELREGASAVQSIEYQKILNKEAAARRRKARSKMTPAEREQDKLEEKLEKMDAAEEERGTEAAEETMSLEELQRIEQSLRDPRERIYEEESTLLADRPEPGLGDYGYSPRTGSVPRRLQGLLNDAAGMIALDPSIRTTIMETYSRKKADIEKATSILQAYAETDYDEARTAKRGGFDERGNMDPTLMLGQGAQLTLRGMRMQSQVRTALTDLLVNDPKAFKEGFASILEEAAKYLKSDAAMPLSKQENLDQEDLAELFLTAQAAQQTKAPKEKGGWTPEEVSEQAELATVIREEFGVSPQEAVEFAQQILYGENLQRQAASAKVGPYGRRYVYTKVGDIIVEMNKLQSRVQETGGELTEESIIRGRKTGRTRGEGSRITEGAAEELLARVRDGSLIRQVRDQLKVSIAKGERQAAEEAAIREVIESMGFHNLGPKLIAGIKADWNKTAAPQIATLQEKINRIEQALTEPDFLRTNFNAPKPQAPPAREELSWDEEIRQKYTEMADTLNHPDDLLKDVRLLKLKHTTPAKPLPNEAVILQDNKSPAEEALRAAEAKKKAAAEAAAAREKSRGLIGKTGLTYYPREGEAIAAEFSSEVYPKLYGAAETNWRNATKPLPEPEAKPEEKTTEQKQTEQHTTPLEDASLDQASAFDASVVLSYYASVPPIRNAKNGKKNIIQWLRSMFSKEHGAVDGTRQLSDAAVGFVQFAHEQAMDNWAQAKKEMPGKWDKAKDDAVTHYLQGMNRNSVAAKTGYTIPSSAIPHLNRLKANVSELGQLGVESGAFTKPSVVAAILGGRGYLSRSLGQTDKTMAQVKQMMPELARLFEEAYPTMTEEQIDTAKKDRLYNMIAHRLVNMQDNISVASYDGEALNREGYDKKYKPGRKYLVQQLNVEGADVPIKLAIVTDTGSVIDLLAPEGQLREIVRDNIQEGATPEEEVQRIVDSMLSDELRLAVSRGRGADFGIQQTRRLLRSDTELIKDAFRSLYRQAGNTKEGRAWIKANADTMASMSIEEALNAAEEALPAEVAGRIEQLRAQSTLNSKIRDALNEITDPATVLSKTVDSIAETIAMANFTGDLYRMLKAQNKASLGKRPAGVKNWERLMPAGTSLGDSNFIVTEQRGDSIGPGVRKAHELYVPVEIAKAVADITGYGREIENNPWGLFSGARKVSQFAKYGKVVLNPLAHPRNLVSTGFIHLSRAAVGVNTLYANKVMFGMAKGQAKLSLGDFGRAWKANKATTEGRNLEKLMLQNNLLFDGGSSGALYDLRKQGFGARSAEAEAYHIGNRAWHSTRNFADTLFRLEDEAVKGAALITYASEHLKFTGNNPDIIEKHLKGGTLTEAEQRAFDKAIKAAAEQVKNTYPTFSRTPEVIKILSRNPIFGAFPSFHSEMLRTTGHVLVDNVNLMRGKLPDGSSVADGYKAQAFVLGATRISTTAALFSAATAITNLMLQWALDDEDEPIDKLALLSYGSEHQRKARGLLAFWQRNALTAVTDIDTENKTYTSIAVSYLSPFGQMNDVLNNIVHTYKDAVEADVNGPEWEALKALGEGLLGTFANVEPLAGSLYKRFRRNVSKRESSNEVKNWANDVDKAIGEVFGGEMGNFLGAIAGGTLEAAAPEAIGQAVSLGKLAAEIMGSAPEDPAAEELAMEAGNRLMSIGEMIGHVAGFKRRNHTFEEDFIPSLAMDKLIYQRANTDFYVALASPDAENYYEDFKQASARREQAFNVLRDRITTAGDLLGADYADILLETQKQGERFRTAGTTTFGEFAMDYYSPPSSEEFWDYLKKSKTLTLTEEEKIDAYYNYADAVATWYGERE